MTVATFLLPLHSYPLNEGVRDHLRATLLLMRVLEVTASSFTVGDFIYLAGDNCDGTNFRRRGGGRRQGRQQRQVPIVPPYHPPVTWSDGRVPSLSKNQLAEVYIGVSTH